MTSVPIDIADTPDALTTAWLTAALRAAGHLGEESVSEATLQPLGTGQMSDAYRLSLRYDRPTEAPTTLVAKLPAADETSRATGRTLGSYEKEVRFYQELAPNLGVRVPRAYYADIEPESARFVLLLEDLAPAEQGDQLAGCTVEVAAAALAQLVPLHAPRWGDESLTELEWLVGDPVASRMFMVALLPMLWTGFQDRYAADLAPHVLEAGQRLFSDLEGYLDADAAPKTVIHGDYRLDNLLIRTDPSPEVVGIVDWQTCTHGAALGDVAYVIGAGLHVDDRRTHEQALVRRYYDDLVAAGIGDYPWDQAWTDYRRGTWAGLVVAVGASMLVERTARGDEMFLAMASRHAQHALDLA